MESLKYHIKKRFSARLNRSKGSAASKQALEKNMPTRVSRLAEASFDIFTDQGEDGIIHYLLGQMENVPSFFVDIGSGDCIKSNCATLAVHYGWKGLFIDRNKRQLSIGKEFYRKIVPGHELEFIESEVRVDNVNELVATAKTREIGLLSIDIDGNDYWIWKAIEYIQPRLVVIEAKVEFGIRNLVVPYGSHNHHQADKMYNGASVEALRILGREKGYKLVGANRPGYNLFFVKNEELIPEANIADVLSAPETMQSVYPDAFFNSHVFEKA